ncbi:MAG TPA: SpoIIE family protein phosphatase [Actinomycetota bacterium]|nr:SpoIIE family protein phosphatase [Actinomycetota bacterium]
MPPPVTPSGKGTERVDRSGQLTYEQLRLLIESVKDYAIFLMDPGGHVVSWNPGAERIKGYRASEILGEHFSRFYSEEERAAGLPAKALAGAAANDRFEEWGWRIRKDGSRFYAHAVITALHDSDGNLRSFAKITQDVTAERQAERMLQEREQQLAQAQAIAQLGSFEWEIGADQVRWTAELRRICGLEPEPTTTTLEAFVACVHPDDRPRVMEAIRRAAIDGTPFRQELRIVCPNGEERVLLSWGRVMHDGQTRPSRMGVVFQDVSEQRHRDERLAEASVQAELARQLQRGLLPTLSLAGLPIRTRYRPGLRRALLGADFYDALELPDGTLATLIGDVAGHGPDGAAVGVALRAAWRALALTGHAPDEVLDGLHEVLVRERPSEEMFTTVCCVLISPDRHEIVVASAGHPPPLLASNGTVQVLDVIGQPALGILEQAYAWQTTRVRGGDAWTLLCYTDGLVEGLQAPGSAERFGIEALAATATRLLAERPGMEGLLDGLLEVVLEANGGDLSDDVAMLCVSTAPAGDGT